MDSIINYFRPMFDFFIENFYLIPAIVGGTVVMEAVVFLILAIVNKKRAGAFQYNFEGFFIISTLSLLAYIVIYALAAFGFTFVNRMKELDWNFWGNYWKFTTEHRWFPIILYVLNGIAALVGGYMGYSKGESLFWIILGVVLGALAGAAALGVLFFVIFLLYFIVALLINFFIAIGYGFAGFGVSIVKFFQHNWMTMTAVIVAPGLFTGLAVALRNYIVNLNDILGDAKANHIARHRS